MIDYDRYVDALINRDNEAFKVIYENTKKGVFSVIISIVNNKAATEDLMQDTYMKMIQKIKLYKKGRNFYAWLLQIAKNTALDYYRRERRNTSVDPQQNEYLFDTAYEEGNDYEVKEMIKDLDQDQQQVVLLRVVSNLKFKTIAKTLDKPLGTVLWLYQKAIRQLQETYREE